MNAPLHYTTRQRWVALLYGLLAHAAFGLAVGLMAFGLFTGLRHAWGRATGYWALPANALLLAQFPLLHSFFLSQRGRRWLGYLAPARLRRELSTTVYALVASLQLTLCFAAWSPLPSFTWTPDRYGFALLSALYVISWSLLVQAMREASLGLHLGSLGWRAVWQQRPVEYPPLPTGVLHRHVRQPIYIAFTLILWTAPTWSWDRLIFTLGWTGYCVAGALLKEQRYRRYFGAAFAAYQQRVPFWFPRLRRRTDSHPFTVPDISLDVIIAGAGPVGLLLANLLGRAGLSVALVETRKEPRRNSMAIGITPPSLDILSNVGLASSFTEAGLSICRATVHEAGETIGNLSFAKVDGEYPYILSLPQAETERLLESGLRERSSVHAYRGWEVVGVQNHSDHARVVAREPTSGREHALAARFVVACDGAHSAIREMIRIRSAYKAYKPCFTMADYVDTTSLGATAHLFFGQERPIESFPLPNGQRRWIIRTGWRDETDLCEPFETTIARLTGHRLPHAACLWRSAFRPRRHEARHFYKNRVILCGDAAHGMSPIGGQGMNTGFGDATLLADALVGILRRGESMHLRFAEYERTRRGAFRRAAARAALGMSLGTWTGTARSHFRRALVAFLLDHSFTHRVTARWFAMRSLPNPMRRNTVAHAYSA